MTKRPLRKIAIVAGASLWALVLISCVMTDRAVVRPAEIAGAKFVGTEACLKCHGDYVRGLHDATHARLLDVSTDGQTRNIACESCHGPGSRHIRVGTRETIVNPKITPDSCLQCHVNVRADFNLPHTHAVLSGKLACTECHDPHRGAALPDGGARSLVAASDAICAKCHQAQSGPFVFEHEAMREGCVSCHSPHGSVNDKMLKSRNVSLCYQCHFQPQANDVAIVHGGVNHAANVVRGTCWTAGCHEAVHGSQTNSSLRF